MSENICNINHKFGPYVRDKEGITTRKCYYCSYYDSWDKIGEDIEEAIKRQDDVSYFASLLINKNISFNSSDDYVTMIKYIHDDINYLYLDSDAQGKFLEKANNYNNGLNGEDKDKYDVVDKALKYFKLYFAKENYEYKNGFNSFPEEEVLELDMLYDNVSNDLVSAINNKKNHLSK